MDLRPALVALSIAKIFATLPGSCLIGIRHVCNCQIPRASFLSRGPKRGSDFSWLAFQPGARELCPSAGCPLTSSCDRCGELSTKIEWKHNEENL